MAWTKEQHRAYAREYNRKNKDKIRAQMKNCALVKKYGVTLEQFSRLLEQQDGRCAICASGLDRGPHTHLDHAHGSGQVRAILCRDCNHMIGNAKERPEVLERAAFYLRMWHWIDELTADEKATAQA